MAIEKKVIQTEVVQQTVPTQGTSGAGSVAEVKTQTSKPIKMTVDKPADDSKKNTEILDYLNSDKFKNLSEAEQLKAFKEKYGVGLSDEELQKLFVGAKKVAAEFAQRTAIESGEDVQATNVASSNDTVKAEITAKLDIIETLKQQGVENPTQGDIYNYLTGLKAEGAELTAEQAKLLKTFNALLDNGFQGLKPSTTENPQAQPAKNQNTQNESLIPIDTVLTKEFMQKDPDEKLKMYMDAYLTKNDPEYAQLSDKKKAKYCYEKASEFAQTLGVNKLRKLSNKEAFNAIALLENSNTKGERIENFADKSLASKVEVAFSNTLKKGLNNLFSRDEFKNKTPQEQMIALGDMLFASDEKYGKLSPDKKLKYLELALQDQIDEMGLPFDLDEADPQMKKDALTYITTILQDFAKQPEDMTLNKYMTKLKDPVVATYKLLETIPDTEENAGLRATLLAKAEILEDLKAQGIENPTYEDMYKYLENKKDLTPEEVIIKKELLARKNFGIDIKKNRPLNKFERIVSRKIANGKSTEQIVNTGFRRFGNDEKALAEYITTIVATDPSRYGEVMALLGKRYSQSEIAKKFPELKPYATSKAMATNRADQVHNILASAPNSKFNDKAYRVSGQIMSEEANTKLFAASMDNNILRQKSANALADRDYYSQGAAVKMVVNLDKLGTVSDSNFAQFTSSYITECGNNGSSDQLYMAEQLTNIGNAAVTEGVAAAANSVEPSARSQFNSIIENAISSGNYSSDEVANINHALNTGNISNETLSRTTPSSSAPARGESKPAAKTPASSQVTNPAKPASTQTPQQIAQAVAQAQAQAASQNPSANQATAGTSQSVNVNTSTSAQATAGSKTTTKTQSSSSAKKSEALDNAANTKLDIDKSIKDWESKHNTTLSESELDTLKSAVSSSVIDEVMNNPDTSVNSKAFVQALVENAANINDLYSKLVSVYGSKVQNKFVETLAAYGSATQIHTFAKNNGSKDVIKDLYLKCGSSTLKSELLNLLSPSSVSEMLAAHQINDLSSVDYKLLKEHIIKNLSNMSNSEFNNYLKYLPFDERQALVKLRLGNNGYNGNEGGDIAAYAEELGFDKMQKNNNNSFVDAGIIQQTREVSPTVQPDAPAQPLFTTAQNNQAAGTSVNFFQEDDVEPFFDTLKETPLTEFTNKTTADTEVDGSVPSRGSDEWMAQLQNIQAGIKVPPSSVYANYSPDDKDFDWDIGAAGPTKLPFGRNYDKQKRGTIYWG